MLTIPILRNSSSQNCIEKCVQLSLYVVYFISYALFYFACFHFQVPDRCIKELKMNSMGHCLSLLTGRILKKTLQELRKKQVAKKNQPPYMCGPSKLVNDILFAPMQNEEEKKKKTLAKKIFYISGQIMHLLQLHIVTDK